MKKLFLVFVLAAAAMFSGCSLSNNGGTTLPAAAFLIAHTSPDATPVDVYVNSSLFVSDVPVYGNTTYVQVAPGYYNFKIVPTGTSTVLIDSTYTLQQNTNYSIFTIDSTSKIKSVIITDSIVVPGTDTARVRFLDFSPNTAPVDFAIAGGGSVWFSNRSFNDQNSISSLANFKAVTAGTYSFEVRTAGTSTVLYSFPNITLSSGKIYTFYLKGFTGGTGTQALSVGTINNL